MAKLPGQSWTAHNIGKLIKFGVKYMESGFLDLLTNGGIGFADTYKPAIIRFNPFVTAKSATLPNASAQRVVADGDESLAVGCSTKLESVDVSSESTSYHFDSDPAAFCDPEVIRQKKLCQLRVPPSVYTGKMRLMVQAIYGSKRNDYAYAAESLGMDNLVLAGVSLGISTPTAGLYTAPDGSYWLIKIGTDVSYQKLKIAGAYQPAIDGEPLSEAYALSRLLPTGDVETMAGSSLSAALSGYDGPLAYGWKFNAAGDKASIVVYGSQTGLATKNYSTGAATTSTGIKMALLTVQLGWDEANLHPNFTSVTTVSTGYHLPFSQCKVFSPVVLLGEPVMSCLMVDYDSLNNVGNYSGPIYCYYDALDVLQVVTVKNGDRSVQSSSDTRPPHKIVGETRKSWVESPHTGQLTPTTIAYGAAGFAINSLDMSAISSTSTGQTVWDKVQYPPDADGPTSYFPPNSGSGVAVRYDFEFAFDRTYFEVSASGNVINNNSLLIIPFGDAAAAIVGTDSRQQASAYNTVVYNNPSNYRYQRDYYNYTSGYVWTTYSHSTYPAWTGSDITGGSVPETLTTEEKEALISESNVKRTHSQTAKLFNVAGSYDVYSAGGTLSTTAPDFDLDLTPLFEVAALSPYYEQVIEVNTSYSGALSYAVVGSISGKQGWPAYTYLSPVGWA